jgi:shikimate dehydrogenase
MAHWPDVDFAVLGSPVVHSLSPRIHAQFAAASGIDLRYDAIELSPDALAPALVHWHRSGARGFNVTLPYKQSVLPLCSALSPRAERAQAVNTLIRTQHGWRGDNTDGVGFIRDLTLRHKIALDGARVLMLGAGGAARGVLAALLETPLSAVVLLNRSEARAQALVQAMADVRVQSLRADQVPPLPAFDLLINASAGARSDADFALPELPLSADAVLYDLSYGQAAKALLRRASDLECVGLDGLGMLIEQAAEAFFLWHGARVSSDAVWGVLRAEI